MPCLAQQTVPLTQSSNQNPADGREPSFFSGFVESFQLFFSLEDPDQSSLIRTGSKLKLHTLLKESYCNDDENVAFFCPCSSDRQTTLILYVDGVCAVT